MPPRVSHDWVLRRRLATQRLTGAPLTSGAQAVRLLTAVQSQDAPLAMWSLGMRTKTTYAGLLAEAGHGYTRTHVLRPTWHFVDLADLRWLQRLTGAKVISGTAARQRQLGLVGDDLVRWMDRLLTVVAAEGPITRRAIQARFAQAGDPIENQALAHLLMAAEVAADICGGPTTGEHTYVLVERIVPTGPLDDLARDEGVRLLVHRFMTGHGPADEYDLARWCTLTLGEIRGALTSLVADGSLELATASGRTLWFDPATPRTVRRRALLVPTFDEATLSYRHTGFPRAGERLDRSRLVAESGGGTVLIDTTDTGLWKRTVRGLVTVTVRAEVPLTLEEREAIASAAEELGRFVGLEAEVSFDGT